MDGCILFTNAQRDVRFMVAANVSLISLLVSLSILFLVNEKTGIKTII